MAEKTARGRYSVCDKPSNIITSTHRRRRNMMVQRQRQLSLSLHEVGTARLIFTRNFLCFDGALVNGNEESFIIHGRPHSSSPLILSRENSVIEMESELEFSDDTFVKNVFDIPSIDTRRLNVTVIESETGIQYLIKNVILHVKEEGQLCELRSDQITFETEEALVGDRADVELRTFLNMNLVGKGHTVHVGNMSLSFQAVAITPNPTPPVSISEDNDVGEHSECGSVDFLK